MWNPSNRKLYLTSDKPTILTFEKVQTTLFILILYPLTCFKQIDIKTTKAFIKSYNSYLHEFLSPKE